MARRFDSDVWALAPPVVDGELVGGEIGIRGVVRWFGGPTATRLPTDLIVPLGGVISQPATQPAGVGGIWGPNIWWPPARLGAGSEIALPYMQFVPWDEAIFIFVVSATEGLAGTDRRAFDQGGAGSRAEALCREIHRRCVRGTLISAYGWGDGPGNTRNFRASSSVNRPGLGPPFTMEVISTSDVVRLPYSSGLNNIWSDDQAAGLYYTQRPPPAAPSTARARSRVINGPWAFWVDINPGHPIDFGSGSSSTTWREEAKQPTARSWTDNHPQSDGGGSSRFAAYGGWALPINTPQQGIWNIGGLMGHAAAYSTRRWSNLLAQAAAPGGQGLGNADAPLGNLGNHSGIGRNIQRIRPSDPRTTRTIFTDMAVFFNVPGQEVGDRTRNWQDLSNSDRSATGTTDSHFEVDFEAGVVQDASNLQRLVGRSVVGPVAGDDVVFRYVSEAFVEGFEARFRARLEEERWSGAVYEDGGGLLQNATHHVVLTVRGVGQWTHFARLGLNGRTYYIDSIRGGGRLGRDTWVVRASAEYPFPAEVPAPSNGDDQEGGG